MNDFIDKSYNYAIVGASNNAEKYGYKVLKNLNSSGFKVFPVNLKEDKIQHLTTYKQIGDIKEKIDIVVFVIPPMATLQVLEEVKQLCIQKVWMQPGSEDNACIDFCKNNSINCIHDKCIMVEKTLLFSSSSN